MSPNFNNKTQTSRFMKIGSVVELFQAILTDAPQGCESDMEGVSLDRCNLLTVRQAMVNDLHTTTSVN